MIFSCFSTFKRKANASNGWICCMRYASSLTNTRIHLSLTFHFDENAFFRLSSPYSAFIEFEITNPQIHTYINRTFMYSGFQFDAEYTEFINIQKIPLLFKVMEHKYRAFGSNRSLLSIERNAHLTIVRFVRVTFYASEHVNIFFYTYDGYSATNTLMIHIFRIPSVRLATGGYFTMFYADDDQEKKDINTYRFSNFTFMFSTRHAF